MEFLPQKTRQTVLEIDLQAILHNFNHFKSIINDHTRFLLVIKAFAYGAGIRNIARLFEHEKVAFLAVACIDEGIELKDAGITQRIIILNAEEEGYRKMIEYGLEPVIYNLRSLNRFAQVLSGVGGHRKPFPIHLKLDTGMHRLGFELEDLRILIPALMVQESLRVDTCLSHLVASGSPEFDEFTHLQFARFREMTALLKEGLGYSFLRHILNSGGIERFPEGQFEMVRLGIGLYGLSAKEDTLLKNVYTWKTVISQVRNVKAGDTVGYNRRWTAPRDARIATCFVGYADGLNRLLGNGKWSFKWQGIYVPIVADVCMDLCMIDITETEAREGDELLIFSSPQEINAMANIMKTIHYEVLTNISKRVRRVYVRP
jgi:alanine racemase